MIWVALWIVLVLAAAAVLGPIGLDVYRKGRAFAVVAADAAARLSEAMAPLQEAADRLEEQRELAVFADPLELRQARVQAAKGKGGEKSSRRSNGRHRSDPRATTRFGATSQGTARAGAERTT